MVVNNFPNHVDLSFPMYAQPDETTCGPTCLNAIYEFWKEKEPLEETIKRTGKIRAGGTFAVYLASDALRRGYDATIYTYNLHMFDPSWFNKKIDVKDCLKRQYDEKKNDRHIQDLTPQYLEFLEMGGRLRFKDLSGFLLRGLIRHQIPLITGLSSTYLYHAVREYGPEDIVDDIKGTPSGHFVVLAGYNRLLRTIKVVDPYAKHRFGFQREYWIDVERVLGALFLGVLTHDANILVIRK